MKGNETIQVSFVGIDSYNRPIFKSITDKSYYGCTEKLFSTDAVEQEVLSKIAVSDLQYFGSHFDCEPYGTTPVRVLEIVKV